MQGLTPDGQLWDTNATANPSMTEDKVTEIFIRLERLDAGQRYVIEQIGGLQSGDRQAQQSVDQLAGRLAKVEWQQEDQKRSLADHERKVAPWRTFWLSIAGAWITALGTALAIHLLAHG